MTWISNLDITGIEPLLIVTVLFAALLVLSVIENVVEIGLKRLLVIIGISILFAVIGGIIYLLYLFFT